MDRQTNVNPPKRQKLEEKPDEDWFVTKGICTNEVTLKFDDGQELYVSVDFLIYASPVFKAMLTSDFIEKKRNMIELKGKSYDGMLMFLKCMHPGIRLSITPSNVALIAALAEEYQIDTIIKKCKNVLITWLRTGLRNKEIDLQVNICLQALLIASERNYTEIVPECISKLSCHSYEFICGEYFTDEQNKLLALENKELLSRLPLNVKVVLFEARLKVCDTNV